MDIGAAREFLQRNNRGVLVAQNRDGWPHPHRHRERQSRPAA
jgi:hypothetical protein